MWGIEIDWFDCVGIEIDFFERGVEIDFVVFRPIIVWFSGPDRLWRSRLTYFFVSAENNLFLMWRSIDLIFVWVVEINLGFVCGPKITWF